MSITGIKRCHSSELLSDGDYKRQIEAWGQGEEIGRGVVSRAYATTHPRRIVLIAEASQEKSQREAAMRQVSNLIALQGCRHIPTLYGHCNTGESFATLQEHMGESISQMAGLAVGIPRLQAIARRSLECLADMHSRNYVHRDIHSNNVCRQGVIDFERSRQLLGDQTAIRGTAYPSPYRPPETAFFNETTYASDVWALGCVLYDLFGDHLFPGLVDPVDSKNGSEVARAELNRLHAIQERLGTKPKVEGVDPDLLETDSATGGKRLKPSTLPKLPPFEEFILNYSREKPYVNFVDLLKRMLEPNDAKRISAKEALEHPFFTSETGWDRAFLLEVIGPHNQMGVQILKGECEETIDLAHLPPRPCYHLSKSSAPYTVAFFKLGEPDKILGRSSFKPEWDRGILQIDVEKLSVQYIRGRETASAGV